MGVIAEIKFKFGKGPAAPPETTKLAPITVFVGPNNSGKTKVLGELFQYCNNATTSTTDVILDKLEFAPPSPKAIEGTLRHYTVTPSQAHRMEPGQFLIGRANHGSYLAEKARFTAIMEHPQTDPGTFSCWFLQFNTLMLDGPRRISHVNSQDAGDIQSTATSSLQVLFRDDGKREQVRRIVHEAFGLYFVIDPTKLGTFRIRLSCRAPLDDREERGIHGAAVKFHADALPIESASDGIKAFIGIITEIIAGDPSVVLIDEPEAFLHPSLAFQLGKEVSRISSASGKSLFVATHSANFVMGCIQSGSPVNIIRLTYRASVATARVLHNDNILRLMRNPLLRSTGVLNGLFYEFVVVTESDTDRAFYQEINERLLRFTPSAGIPNCLFLNAQNKQTVQTLIRPLRDLGIPAAAIVDVDVLKDGGATWSGFLEGGCVPQIDRQAMANIRAAVKSKLEATGKNMKRDGGIDLLSGEDKEAAKNLLQRLAEYGLFVLPKGELESWLPQLGVNGHGPNWLVNIFEKMGEDPNNSEYVKPGSGDVWDFIATLKRWLTDPNRKGIPY
ncbi:MAG: ATPase [Candidatus Angelobacter sp. Gp1-AA117]|nr:MAG: ATPase [Candidatus Angelobacter sp. Gp1-AA117]